MFRLKRILGSPTFALDTIRMPIRVGGTVNVGTPLADVDGELQIPGTSAPPTHIILEKRVNSTNPLAKCCIITPAMIFKVTYKGTDTPTVGMRVVAATKKTLLDSVTSNADGYAVIVYVHEEGKSVDIRFIK